MDTDKIQNIIFDLGGVIVNIEPKLTAEAFADLSGTDPVDIMELHQSANFFTAYEKGLITDAVFRREVCNFLKRDIPDQTIDVAWGALLQEIPPQKIDMITAAHKNYRTFLLSNTNNIHRIKFCRTFQDLTGRRLEEYFEKVYYSFEMGKRKPDEGIFLQVLQDNDLDPGETLLVDDSLPNIQTAISLGMKTLHVERNQEKIDLNTNGRN
ncbi:MAG: HAD family phosphatase [Cyclobacteriaceae bacterium]|nr:HAD family phosphatase [Cyclobacteriaceae bacterium]